MAQRSERTQFPPALVFRWNCQTLRARCPYCLVSHGHGFAEAGAKFPEQKLREPGRRHGDCADGGEYWLTFPGSQDPEVIDYGWEFDSETLSFITVNSQGTVTDPVDDWRGDRTLLPQFSEQCQSKQMVDKPEDAGNGLDTALDRLTLDGSDHTGPIRQQDNYLPDGDDSDPDLRQDDDLHKNMLLDPGYRRSLFWGHCIRHEMHELRRLCERYPDDRFYAAVDEEGNTGILLAAAEEGGLESIRLLEGLGGSLSQANHYGRTPLMEAALWGRFDTVRYLTRQAVDLDARDGNEMRAIELAANSRRNRNERTRRSGLVYREALDADRQRDQIEAHLNRFQAPEPRSAQETSRLPSRAFFERKPTGELVIYRPQVLLEIPGGPKSPQLQKAFATLDRGPNYPKINVMSGYSHAGHPNVLDNSLWTDKAERLCAMLGLSRSRSLASHVEPQSLAYLLDRHSLHMVESHYARQELASVLPMYDLKPVITVNKPDLCRDCLQMFEAFKAKFRGFNVTFHCVGDLTAPRLQVRN